MKIHLWLIICIFLNVFPFGRSQNTVCSSTFSAYLAEINSVSTTYQNFILAVNSTLQSSLTVIVAQITATNTILNISGSIATLVQTIGQAILTGFSTFVQNAFSTFGTTSTYFQQLVTTALSICDTCATNIAAIITNLFNTKVSMVLCLIQANQNISIQKINIINAYAAINTANAAAPITCLGRIDYINCILSTVTTNVNNAMADIQNKISLLTGSSSTQIYTCIGTAYNRSLVLLSQNPCATTTIPKTTTVASTASKTATTVSTTTSTTTISPISQACIYFVQSFDSDIKTKLSAYQTLLLGTNALLKAGIDVSIAAVKLFGIYLGFNFGTSANGMTAIETTILASYNTYIQNLAAGLNTSLTTYNSLVSAAINACKTCPAYIAQIQTNVATSEAAMIACAIAAYTTSTTDIADLSKAYELAKINIIVGIVVCSANIFTFPSCIAAKLVTEIGTMQATVQAKLTTVVGSGIPNLSKCMQDAYNAGIAKLNANVCSTG